MTCEFATRNSQVIASTEEITKVDLPGSCIQASDFNLKFPQPHYLQGTISCLEVQGRSAEQKIPCFIEHEGSLPCSQTSEFTPVYKPRPIYLRSILILSSHLRLGSPSHIGLFPTEFQTSL
jgi:hypothetical protein